jgi:hypothetical protein
MIWYLRWYEVASGSLLNELGHMSVKDGLVGVVSQMTLGKAFFEWIRFVASIGGPVK